MRYIPHTETEVTAMLAASGVSSLDELFAQIPEELRLRRPLCLPPPLDEAALRRHLAALADGNRVPGTPSGPLCFLGAGLHAHTIPAAVDALLGRAELYTAYTPYQPEISQGTLQAMFEFQTMVAELLGLDTANASMYDGASAAAEAVLMARRLTGRRLALLCAGLHPEYRQVIATYLCGLDERGPLAAPPLGASGQAEAAALEPLLEECGGELACIVVQTPSFLGVLSDLRPLAELAHRHGALLVSVTAEPLALAIACPPGAAGADIAVAEGIGLALPPSLGGPGVGLLAARDEHLRAMPGRLIGETVDVEGRRGYVLTLATREQHIRREKATSNICTNHGLAALALTIHLSLLGKTGFVELARLNLARCEHLKRALLALPGFALRYHGPTFNELAVRLPGGDAQRTCDRLLAEQGIVAGLPLARFDRELADTLLVGVSELHDRADLDRLASALADVEGSR